MQIEQYLCVYYIVIMMMMVPPSELRNFGKVIEANDHKIADIHRFRTLLSIYISY